MKPVLPPNFKPPFWATRDFRLLIIGISMSLAVLAVLIFDIGPKLTQKPQIPTKTPDPKAYVPAPAAPGAARDLKFEGVLEKVKDGSSIDDQEEPYQYLIRYLARADAAQFSKDPKTVEYPTYAKFPAEMRGETVKIRTLFLQSSPIRVDAAPGGVNFIHRTYLSNLSGNEGYVVDLLEPPGELASKTVVDLEAVFFKLGTYEGKKGPVQAPLFLGKGLRVVKERMAESPVTNGGVLLGIAGGTMVLMLVLTSRMFKKSKPPAPRNPAVSAEALKS